MAKDLCTKEGAGTIINRIKQRWGDKVDVKPVGKGFHPSMRSSRTDVESDMVNGLPKGFVWRPGVGPVPKEQD